MYTLEINLKHSPAPVGVMIKETEVATERYQTIVTALRSGDPLWLELTCDRTQKQVIINLGQVAAVQLTPKQGGGNTTISRPGFSVQQVESAS